MSEMGQPDSEAVDQDVAGEGDEGRRAAQSTPPIGRDAQPGQTEVPAPADDVGVPSDEQIAEEEERAG